MRPVDLDEFVGQKHLLGENNILRKAINENSVGSIILWGPPGSGKTTLAKIICKRTDSLFVEYSAVTSGIKEIKEVIKKAKYLLESKGKKTVIFIDEIHRFNKAQQDAFLPYVEKGIITLIGATTENPSFEVIAPLLSRMRIYTLKPLSKSEILEILKKAVNDSEKGIAKLNLQIDDNTLSYIASLSNGDARMALNTLEAAALSEKPDKDGKRIISQALIKEVLQSKSIVYDKDGEEHYNLISAFHKSLRGSDVNASLYWLARMLEAGEDPLYIARRMVRFASEDIGNADPQALTVALNSKSAVEFIGMPEGDLALAQAAIYLATAPKSNATYKAYLSAKEKVKEKGYLPVPLHLRNPVTDIMRKEGYGSGYKYPHNYKNAIVNQKYIPEELEGENFYIPSNRGFEKTIAERISYWKKKLEEMNKGNND